MEMETGMVEAFYGELLKIWSLCPAWRAVNRSFWTMAAKPSYVSTDRRVIDA